MQGYDSILIGREIAMIPEFEKLAILLEIRHAFERLFFIAPIIHSTFTMQKSRDVRLAID